MFQDSSLISKHTMFIYIFNFFFCRFGSKHLLTNHVRAVHLKKYMKICDICGKKFQVKFKFERHMLEHTGGPQPTADCDICGFKAMDKTLLKRHKDSQHPAGGRQEYKCHLCPKVSPTLRAHKIHVQYKHELGYDFKCTMCDKAFKRSHSLKVSLYILCRLI